MPRSYWLPVIAVVGLALASSVGANPIAAHDHLNGNASQSQQQVAAKYQGVAQPSPPIAETDIERLASALKAANANPYASAEQKRASEYLQTQRDMVKWAGRMFWVGLVEAADHIPWRDSSSASRSIILSAPPTPPTCPPNTLDDPPMPLGSPSKSPVKSARSKFGPICPARGRPSRFKISGWNATP